MATQQTPTFTLYRGWPTPGEFVWSPFVTKVELRLRHSKVKYTAESGSTTQSPTGKVPYINVDYGNNHSDTFSDSTLIIKRLVQETHLRELNANLTPEQNLTDLSIRALLEEKLYFYHTRERWMGNYHTHRDYTLGNMSLPMRTVIGLLIYRNIKAMLHAQGTGRFTDDEIELNRREIWSTIENQLVVARNAAAPGRPFWILGLDEPTEADATLFAFVSSVLVAKSGPRSREVVRGFPAVMEYADRIFKTYFSEYRHWDD